MATEDSLGRAEELLARLEAARGELDRLGQEEGGSPERALELLSELSELAKSVEEELERAKRAAELEAPAAQAPAPRRGGGAAPGRPRGGAPARPRPPPPPAGRPGLPPAAPGGPMPHSPDELRALADERLETLELWPQLHGQAESVRYSLTVGGKRVRPVICLATAEAAGAAAEVALPAACALELVHTFSLVHDDLPALDADEERRGQPSTWKQFGEAEAILAGDALLAEAFRLACVYETPHVARELAAATLGMIGGQYLDITNTAPDEATLHRLKTGCLFAASVGLALWAAWVPEDEQAAWRAFGDELGLLFQIVDDVLDGDGYVLSHGIDGARTLADEAAERARSRLAEVDADTSVLREIVDGLAVRTA